jgi:predicted Zn-dependent protease
MAAFSVSNLGAQNPDSPIFRAMNDELSRSMSDLVMENLERPYFISYTVDDIQNLNLTGVLGTLTRTDIDRNRFLTITLRVGDPALDNTNFVAGFYDYRQNYFPVSFEDNYDAIRNDIYLATDKLYKGALKTLSKKRAYLQTRVIADRPEDFIAPMPIELFGKPETFDIDKKQFESIAVAVSEVFRSYPEIISSSVRINAAVTNQYFVNSAGSKSLRGDRIYNIELTMEGKNGEGEDIIDCANVIARKLDGLPEKTAMVKWAKQNAERMRLLLVAPEVEEYAGPVILTGDAAGEFFRQLFAKNVSDGPSPLYEKEQMAKSNPGPELVNKVKRRVLPEFIDIFDDPSIESLGTLNLIGGYAVDDAGMIPRRIQLVEEGKLVGLPIALAPTKHVKEPNGHARGGVGRDVSARLSNLIVESSDKVPFDKLKTEMLEICRDMGLEYGLIVRKLLDPNSPQASQAAYFGGGSRRSSLTAPIEAYKVYPDGREEAVTNLEFSDVTVRILKDIVRTGDEAYCYNYLIGADNEMPASIVCPPLLIEEMELKRSESKIEKPMVLPSPLAKK